MDSLSENRLSLRDRFRAATRDAILEAAAGLLSADDAARIRMEDIASRAGIAVGTLYNHFHDRGALVAELLEARQRALAAALDAAASGEDTTAGFEADLHRFVAVIIEYFDQNRFLLHILFESERSRGVDAKSASRRHSVLAELFARADRLMSRGIRVKALRKGEPTTYGALLVGMVRGVLMRAMVSGEPLSPGVSRDIVRVFMTGASR
jgi:AcrR family transcriptional regulator